MGELDIIINIIFEKSIHCCNDKLRTMPLGPKDFNVDELERFVVAAVKSGMGKEKIVQYAIKVLRNLRVQLQLQREEVLKLKTQQALLSKREEEDNKQLLEKKSSEQVKWDNCTNHIFKFSTFVHLYDAFNLEFISSSQEEHDNDDVDEDNFADGEEDDDDMEKLQVSVSTTSQY